MDALDVVTYAENTINAVENQAVRIMDFADALLERVKDDDTVSMALLAEIKDKARAIHDLLQDPVKEA